MPVEVHEINVIAGRSTIWTYRMERSWSDDMKGVDTHEEPTYPPRPDLEGAYGVGHRISFNEKRFSIPYPTSCY